MRWFWSAARCRTPRRGLPRRALRLEVLEARQVLSAAPLSAEVAESALTSSEQILVRFRAEALESLGSLPKDTWLGGSLDLVPGLFTVRLSQGFSVTDALAAFRADPRVEYAQPDFLVQVDAIPNDPSFGSLWGLHNTGQSSGTADADIDAVEAWNLATGSGNIVVGVVDTGIDYNHPDLRANIWSNTDEIAGNGRDDDGNGYVDDIRGWDWVNNDNDPMDDNSHGTHVAGTIGAVGNNGVGVVGVAWNVKLMPLKILGADGSGYTSGAIRALDYARLNGAKVTNNSWGGGGYSQALADAVERARQAGVIVVAAAGNDATNNDVSPTYPANYAHNNVVTVAASDRRDNLASFSNYGTGTVEIAAPGVSILSTVPGGGYGSKSGTSMATPHVAGALALVWSAHPAWNYRQVIDQVLQRTDPVLNGVTTYGRLNVYRALATSSIDTDGPRVIRAGWFGTAQYTLDRIELSFNEPVIASTLSAADFAVRNPGGGVINVSGITQTGPADFIVRFPVQSALGTYTVTIGPNITDLVGNQMNQDVDAQNGEVPADQFPGSFPLRGDVDGPRVVRAGWFGSAAGQLDRLELRFHEAISAGSLAAADFVFRNPSGGQFNVSSITQTSPTDFIVRYPTQTASGTYTVQIGPHITDLAGNPMNQDTDGINGEVPADQFPGSFPLAGDTAGPRVVRAGWFGSAVGQLNRLELSFHEAINASTLSAADVVLRDPSGTPIAVSSITQTGPVDFVVNFPAQTASGTYTVLVGPNIFDLAGNPMNQDTDGLNGEVPADQFPGSFPLQGFSTFAWTGSTPIADRASVSIPLDVNLAGTLADLDVQVALTHTYDSDLRLTLISPGGGRVTLFNRRGGSGNDLRATFDDSAATAIAAGSAPFAGIYRPEQPLSALVGTAISGRWNLLIEDLASRDVGTVTSWTLIVRPAAATSTTTAAANTNSAGSAINGNSGSGNSGSSQVVVSGGTSSGAGSTAGASQVAAAAGMSGNGGSSTAGATSAAATGSSTSAAAATTGNTPATAAAPAASTPAVSAPASATAAGSAPPAATSSGSNLSANSVYFSALGSSTAPFFTTFQANSIDLLARLRLGLR